MRRGAAVALLLAVAVLVAAGCGGGSTSHGTATEGRLGTVTIAGRGKPGSTPPKDVAGGQSAVRTLTLRQEIGQRMVFAYSGTRPPEALKRRIRRGEAAGVILFARNITTAAQLRTQMAALQRLRGPLDRGLPLLVMVDQEGGAVRRLPGGPLRAPGQTRDAADARRLGSSAAAALKRAGANVDIAPVVDVARAGSAMAAEGRAYGSAPDRVAARADAFARGLRADGVHPVYKHFPGFGAATVNTDDAAARIDLPLSALRAADLKPYNNVDPDAVMVSTAIYPRVDPRPAVFSRRWVTQELRDGIKGYKNVVTMTDDLQAPAVARYGTSAQLAFFAMTAGVDLPVFAKDYMSADRAARGLEQAVRSGKLSRQELAAGVQRVRAWRARLNTGP
ncbi:glycoside hydrolase family 3 N-terminal domain-containing protein [Conexibacter woesei]|uniref:glycoside hydrolase family 3 N-terminal domain-containing protein n=1 Tax=Conexibacter woesei TaxID=191495 RepID=UPI000414A7FE|nr:glycoside hydrolase family 3 N-terminal domain-containing protein [Conexibacter woesei]